MAMDDMDTCISPSSPIQEPLLLFSCGHSSKKWRRRFCTAAAWSWTRGPPGSPARAHLLIPTLGVRVRLLRAPPLLAIRTPASPWLRVLRLPPKPHAKNDSVLVVSRDDYKLCNADKPEQRFDNGADVRFRLDRNGNFYFISGTPGHCKAGQRMTVRDSPAGAPSPASDDEDDSGGSYRTPGSGYSSGLLLTPPHGNTSATAAFSLSHGGGGADSPRS
ncbi:early nodulin-like protein 2 [Oryza glaberrima]|uniref:early nodulin-like protein 2 n=1 Tax=Oryza glaberrima TaxID=4538 RepID=UPI00224C49E4|nr:early nodulin-like protein 2 [Oryza glaberrima]